MISCPTVSKTGNSEFIYDLATVFFTALLWGQAYSPRIVGMPRNRPAVAAQRLTDTLARGGPASARGRRCSTWVAGWGRFVDSPGARVRLPRDGNYRQSAAAPVGGKNGGPAGMAWGRNTQFFVRRRRRDRLRKTQAFDVVLERPNAPNICSTSPAFFQEGGHLGCGRGGRPWRSGAWLAGDSPLDEGATRQVGMKSCEGFFVPLAGDARRLCAPGSPTRDLFLETRFSTGRRRVKRTLGAVRRASPPVESPLAGPGLSTARTVVFSRPFPDDPQGPTRPAPMKYGCLSWPVNVLIIAPRDVFRYSLPTGPSIIANRSAAPGLALVPKKKRPACQSQRWFGRAFRLAKTRQPHHAER